MISGKDLSGTERRIDEKDLKTVVKEPDWGGEPALSPSPLLFCISGGLAQAVSEVPTSVRSCPVWPTGSTGRTSEGKRRENPSLPEAAS